MGIGPVRGRLVAILLLAQGTLAYGRPYLEEYGNVTVDWSHRTLVARGVGTPRILSPTGSHILQDAEIAALLDAKRRSRAALKHAGFPPAIMIEIDKAFRSGGDHDKTKFSDGTVHINVFARLPTPGGGRLATAKAAKKARAGKGDLEVSSIVLRVPKGMPPADAWNVRISKHAGGDRKVRIQPRFFRRPISRTEREMMGKKVLRLRGVPDGLVRNGVLINRGQGDGDLDQLLRTVPIFVLMPGPARGRRSVRR